MMVIRPIAAHDLDALLAMATAAGVGLTTLPADRAQLEKRIAASLDAFAGRAHKADEIFVFVLEDVDMGGVGSPNKIVGTCAVAAAVGLRQPWYSYRVGLVVHASQELGIFTQTPTLFLSNDHTGHSELCSLFLDPEYRHGRNGSLLSKSRFLFVAQFRHLFAEKMIAELRGVSDEHGKSPFWESLGRHFFSMDFSQADYLTGIGKKSFVAELMPKHPLYSSFLTPEAQAVIGKTHELTEPARRLLESEGFRYEGYVDIFDAGPAVECDVDDIDAVAASGLYVVEIGERVASTEAVDCLVANTRFDVFRASVLVTKLAGQKIILSNIEASALGVRDGDTLRVVPLSVRDRAAARQRRVPAVDASRKQETK
jgi:arginine N-succinyltransferase